MNPFSFLKPKPTISERELDIGLRWLVAEGALNMGMFSITTSGFLAAFALALGANNLQIGILAALPYIMQVLQIPAIFLVEKFRQRKAIAVGAFFPAQLIWFLIALVPFIAQFTGRSAVSLLLILMTVRGLLTATSNAGWNGWVRDLIPPTILGKTFSRRMSLGTVVSVVFGLGAAFFVDFWGAQVPSGGTIFGYTFVILFGALFLGLPGVIFMSFVPEPLMPPLQAGQSSLWSRLLAPLKDLNFLRLSQFLLTWGFASNLAIPFFAVYMLQILHISLSLVIALNLVGQFFNILFLRVWGRFVDRFGNKVVLSLCASLYLLVILGWVFTTFPEIYVLIPLLVGLHIFAGIANAGVNLTVSTIGMKLAPRGESTAYLAGASLANNLGAGLGPLVGGLLADFFAVRRLDLTLTWSDPSLILEVPAISLAGFTFLFIIAFILGLLTIGLLRALHEEGTVSREAVLESLMTSARDNSRPLSSLPLDFIRRVPVPGLDVAFGVTAYQIAEMSRLATLAAVQGHKITRKIVKGLSNSLMAVWSNGSDREHAVDTAREAARGALHAVETRHLDSAQLEEAITEAVIKASGQAGVRTEDAITGASMGIIQGAAELGLDLGVAALQALKAARQVAAQSGFSQEHAATHAAQGVFQAATKIGKSALGKVQAALSEDFKPS